METEIGEVKIIENCQQGRLANFGLLYDLYVKKIYGFIYYRVQDKETAQDITSSTFLKALDKIKSFDFKRGSFQSWLYQISRNALIDYFRAKHSNVSIDDVWSLKDEQDIEADIDNRAMLERVKKYLQKLTPEQREVVILRVWQDLPYKEIAEIMQKSEASCKMMFSRTIDVLRKEMPMLLFLIFFVVDGV